MCHASFRDAIYFLSLRTRPTNDWIIINQPNMKAARLQWEYVYIRSPIAVLSAGVRFVSTHNDIHCRNMSKVLPRQIFGIISSLNFNELLRELQFYLHTVPEHASYWMKVAWRWNIAVSYSPDTGARLNKRLNKRSNKHAKLNSY